MILNHVTIPCVLFQFLDFNEILITLVLLIFIKRTETIAARMGEMRNAYKIFTSVLNIFYTSAYNVKITCLSFGRQKTEKK
jgi:hypothetical protein